MIPRRPSPPRLYLTAARAVYSHVVTQLLVKPQPMNIIYKSKCDEKMSIKCILPPVNFCGVRRRQRKIDDRPFPEDDYKVFPRENLYDRIVLPGKFYQFVNFYEGNIYMSIIFLRNHKVLQSVF